MARNRKYQSAAIRFGPALKAALLCLLIGGSGIGYVWQKNQIYELGQQIRKRELEQIALQNQNEKLKKQLAMMCSPACLETQNKRLNLGLVPPERSQIWTLKEPVPEPPAADPPQYAARQAPAVAWRE